MLDNMQQLIQEQTRNDTTDPKSGGMNNERYHSLEDVNQELHTLTSERKKKHICILQIIILLWDLFMFLSKTFHVFIQIYYLVNKTSQEHPDMTKLILIGSSFEKNPLYVLKVNFVIPSRKYD